MSKIKKIKCRAMREGYDIIRQRDGLYNIRLNYEEKPFIYNVPLSDINTFIQIKKVELEKEDKQII